MSKFLYFLFLVCLLFCRNFIYSQTNRSLVVGFTRTITKENTIDVVKGNLYFRGPTWIIIKVIEPINQWLVYKDSIMHIYYPDERKAFRFNYKTSFSLPFYQTFILAGIEDEFGLSKAGFKLVRHDIKADTLLSYWESPKNLKKMLDIVIIGLIKDKLVKIEILDKKGKKKAKTTYNNYFYYNKYVLPLEINSIVYHKNDSVVEKVIYTNPQFDVALPQEIVNFEIPNDVKIKEIEW